MGYYRNFTGKEIQFYHFYGRFSDGGQDGEAGQGLDPRPGRASKSWTQAECWSRMLDCIEKVSTAVVTEQSSKAKTSWGAITLGAFVLMDTHFHGIIRMHPDARGDWTCELVKAWNAGGIFLLSVEEVYLIRIDNQKVLRETIKYIYLNPVKAGLSKMALDYPYSTYRKILFPNEDPMPKAAAMLEDPLHLILNPFQVEH